MQNSNIIKKIYQNTHMWIVFMCIGIWVLVFQNLGIGKTKDVYVVGGEIESHVNGSVSIDNTVDVNLHEINGYRNCFYNSYAKHPNDYYRIPVSY